MAEKKPKLLKFIWEISSQYHGENEKYNLTYNWEQEHEGKTFKAAAKEAETDAMKRALMTFGNIFGLALYAKNQTEVEVEVYEYPLPEPKNGGTPDDVLAWVLSQGGRVEGGVIKSTQPIARLE